MSEILTGQEFVDEMKVDQPKSAVKIYVVDTSVSSENRTEGSVLQGEKQKLITFTFPKETRDKIQAIRMKHSTFISYGTFKFHKTTLCSEEAKAGIETAILAARTDLQTLRNNFVHATITEKVAAKMDEYTKGRTWESEEAKATDLESITEKYTREVAEEVQKHTPMLGATVVFIPLDFNQIFKGSLYGQISDSIKYQVYSNLFTRMETMLKRTTEGKEIPERSKEALLKMITTLRTVNVTKDGDIEGKLNEIKAAIESGDLKTVTASLKAELDAGKSRWAAIEL